MMHGVAILFWLVLGLLAQAGFAAIEEYSFADEEQEARFKNLTCEMY